MSKFQFITLFFLLIIISGCSIYPSRADKVCGPMGVRHEGQEMLFCKDGTSWHKSQGNFYEEANSETAPAKVNHE